MEKKLFYVGFEGMKKTMKGLRCLTPQRQLKTLAHPLGTWANLLWDVDCSRQKLPTGRSRECPRMNIRGVGDEWRSGLDGHRDVEGDWGGNKQGGEIRRTIQKKDEEERTQWKNYLYLIIYYLLGQRPGGNAMPRCWWWRWWWGR